MVPLSQFFSRLLPQVLGCSEPLAQQALLDSAYEFCSQSLILSQTLDPITVPTGFPSVEIEAPTDLQIAQVLSATFDGQLLEPMAVWGSAGMSAPDGTPRMYWGQDIDEVYHLTVLPAPDRLVRNGLEVRVALAPTRSATRVPTILYDAYADAVICGALATLYSTPDQPFTNEPKAQMMASRARVRTNQARGDAIRGRLVTSLSVQMRAF